MNVDIIAAEENVVTEATTETAIISTTEEVTGRAVKKGDTATIDFVGKMNGEAFDADHHRLSIGDRFKLFHRWI